MSDIKNVLTLLCQHLSLSTDVTLKPEYFRSAKFNITADSVTEAFWKLLDILSFHAVRKKQIDVDFREYERLSAVKLHFAYLQYPVIEFYALTEKSNNDRQLLLAFAWLVSTQDALNTVIQATLANSILGRECSRAKELKKKDINNDQLGSTLAQINNILYINGKINYNVKEISELISERAKLITKVHAASINVSGLPHLSVSELALTKRFTTVGKGTYTDKQKDQIKELSKIATLLDTHMKWMKKESHFLEWMMTVIQEHKKTLNASVININWHEVTEFIYLLRCILTDRLELVSSKEAVNNALESKVECSSRLLMSEDSNTEIGDWLTGGTVQLVEEAEDLNKKREELSKELKKLLKLIPSCVQV